MLSSGDMAFAGAARAAQQIAHGVVELGARHAPEPRSTDPKRAVFDAGRVGDDAAGAARGPGAPRRAGCARRATCRVSRRAARARVGAGAGGRACRVGIGTGSGSLALDRALAAENKAAGAEQYRKALGFRARCHHA